MKITLCGSARFEKQFHDVDETLTMAGHIVYSLAVYPSSKGGKKNWYSDKAKTMLDLAHLAKIEESDAIIVVSDASGYYGESTTREIAWAQMRKKVVFHMEDITRICQGRPEL